jgi:hypothetical protein
MSYRLPSSRRGNRHLLPVLATVALLGLAGTGCWRLHDTAVDYGIVPLRNENTSKGSVWVRAYDTDLACPDGEYASFYVVYDDEAREPAPVAIVFHSGAFDYVTNSVGTDPTVGTHYATANRLSAAWAKERVFFTLGMWEPEDEVIEKSNGSLATALAQKGVVTLYPANCWGDLWHNERLTNRNDFNTDSFYREGLTFAWWMVQLLVNQSFATAQGFDPPMEIDASKIYLFGLGDGGRAIPEVLLRSGNLQSTDLAPTFAGVFLDSSPDDLSYYLQNTQYVPQIKGLQRIFFEDDEPYGHYSLLHFLSGTPLMGGGGTSSTYVVPKSLDVVWSSQDNVVTDDMIEPLTRRVEQWNGYQGHLAETTNTQLPGHVFVNSNISLANDAVNTIFAQ